MPNTIHLLVCSGRPSRSTQTIILVLANQGTPEPQLQELVLIAYNNAKCNAKILKVAIGIYKLIVCILQRTLIIDSYHQKVLKA